MPGEETRCVLGHDAKMLYDILLRLMWCDDGSNKRKDDWWTTGRGSKVGGDGERTTRMAMPHTLSRVTRPLARLISLGFGVVISSGTIAGQPSRPNTLPTLHRHPT